MELLAVLVLIGIVTSIAIASIAVIIEKAKEEVCNIQIVWKLAKLIKRI